MVENQPSTGHWSVKHTREVELWCFDFTEHWTYKQTEDGIRYKLRVVGPNGEVARTEMAKDEVPSDVRASFEDTFRTAAHNA